MSVAAADGGAADRRSLARGGGLSLIGSATSALLGFLVTILITRSLGDAGAGQVLQAIAVATIAMAVGRAGMDSVAIWLLPRLTDGRIASIRGAVALQLAVAAVSGTACAVLVAAAVPPLLPDTDPAVIHAVAWFIPAGTVGLVALAATRGLGGVRGYVAIGSIGLPSVRFAAVGVASAAGTVAAIALGWALPLVAALIAALVVAAIQIRRKESAAGISRRHGTRWTPDRELMSTSFRYAMPRTVSAVLEQSLLWLDVILVGALAGSAASGDYGAASRLIAAGLIIDTALRVVVSPRFSALLHSGRVGDAQALYRTAATWLVLFSTPIYLVLGAFAPLVLSWFGEGFRDGSTALMILCVGAIITFLAGNVHSVLLMSGRSGLAAINKVLALTLNVAGNVVLVPLIGIEGAALSWAAAMLLDAILATVQVRRVAGIRPDAGRVAYALLVPLVSVGVPALLSRLLLGPTLPALLVTLAAGAVLFLAWVVADSRRLDLRDLRSLTTR